MGSVQGLYPLWGLHGARTPYTAAPRPPSGTRLTPRPLHRGEKNPLGRSPGSGAGGAGSTAIPPRPRAARGRHALLRPLNGRLCSPLALALFVPRTIGLFTGPGRRKTRRRKNRLCRGVPASGEAFFGVFHPPQRSVGSEELSAPEVRAWCPRPPS